jgi:hypothetical protein
MLFIDFFARKGCFEGENLDYRIEVRFKRKKGIEGKREKGLMGREAREELNYEKT